MKRSFHCWVAVLFMGACSGSHPKSAAPPDDRKRSEVRLVALEIEPATAKLTTGAQATSADFKVTARFSDEHTEDMTQKAMWSSSMGSVSQGHFTAPTDHGGRTKVRAQVNDLEAAAEVAIELKATRVSSDDGSTATDQTRALFDGATAEPSLTPELVYPFDQVIVPRNLGKFSVQWKHSATAKLFEVKFSSELLDYAVYTSALLPKGAHLNLSGADWTAIAETAAGSPVAIKVRAIDPAAPSKVGESAAVTVNISADSVSGGIYYWSTTPGLHGIYRHQFGDTESDATPFYGKADTGGKCVACHVLSRDGKKMAVTFDQGDGYAALLDTRTKQELIPQASGAKWNFATMNPDATRMVASSQGKLNLYDLSEGQMGKILGQVNPPELVATHPDWSPDGHSLVYVQVTRPKAKYDWQFEGGALVVTSDSGSGFSLTPTTLVPAAPQQNNYYPSYSPDGKWILFNRSTGNANDDPTADVFVISSDGKVGPIALARANSDGDLTNSMPRWTPFVQTGKNGDLYYLTFSSKRDYGVELTQSELEKARQQLWMTTFDPQLAQKGEDPSSAPFRLPFQKLETSNHIAQWTQTLVK